MSIDNELEKAHSFLAQQKYKEAFDSFNSLHQSYPDNSQVLLNLGWLYQTGSGVDADLQKAIDIYKVAADKGEVLGDYYLATIYQSKNEMTEAVNHFKKSADNGHSSSCYWLGTMYLNGEGCQVDIKKAEHYLTTAMNQGHVFAKRDIALANIKGTFGKRNIFTGISNYIAAVLKGTFLAFKDYENSNLR